MAAERFINKKNGRAATVERKDEKCGTVILMYEDGQGGTTVTTATLKRWWKKVQEEEVEAAEPVVNTESNEDVCGDGTPYTQVMKEIVKGAEKRSKAAQAAEKKATKKKEKKVAEPWVDEDLEYIYNLVTSQDDVVFVPATPIKMRTFKTGGHMYAKLNYSSKSITLAVKGDAVDVQPHKEVNHMFNYVFVFQNKLSGEDKKLVTKLLKQSRAYRVSKNTKKEEK